MDNQVFMLDIVENLSTKMWKIRLFSDIYESFSQTYPHYNVDKFVKKCAEMRKHI